MERVRISGYRIHSWGRASHSNLIGPRVSPRFVARDRFLFRAGRVGYTYPDVLEVQAGSARLLVPSKTAKLWTRAVLTGVAVAYVFLAGPILAAYGFARMALPAIAVWIGFVLYLVGFFAILFWWDHRNLSTLANNPAYVLPLEILAIDSYGTFQEIRARAGESEVRVAVPGPRRRLEAALTRAGIPMGTQ